MDPQVLKTIAIATVTLVVFVVVPIVAMLLEHQRKMVRLMRGESTPEGNETLGMLLGATPKSESPELAARVAVLEAEVAQLRTALGTTPAASAEPNLREILA